MPVPPAIEEPVPAASPELPNPLEPLEPLAPCQRPAPSEAPELPEPAAPPDPVQLSKPVLPSDPADADRPDAPSRRALRTMLAAMPTAASFTTVLRNPICLSFDEKSCPR